MTIITDSDLHDSLCQICIESPHSLLSELGYAAKQKIIETTVCISYKKGDLIYQGISFELFILVRFFAALSVIKE